MPVDTMAQIGKTLRPLMDSNGYQGVKLLGYDHNWVDEGAYPVQLVRQSFFSAATCLQT